ncbi:hypothetical protein Pint_02126 [Pistacia integerrima]|uniref:Uncharacterized protein n=1 Tax=Pistacia integerrima TaxID=434235 RepID=A0ACC0ZG60_9ROSI|nr:hypothetical protein Pint_02126 [Pistacia integerrima]
MLPLMDQNALIDGNNGEVRIFIIYHQKKQLKQQLIGHCDCIMATKFVLLRRLSRFAKPSLTHRSRSVLLEPLRPIGFSENKSSSRSLITTSRNFCSGPLSPSDDSQVPAAIDYHSLLQEDEFHRLANSTIHDLQEKLEEYGDIVQIDGFDVDYGNEVLTLKLGALGTYVLNKQTPNRQIWLSSPVRIKVNFHLEVSLSVILMLKTSGLEIGIGPSRFDWDRSAQAWVYRRTRANLLKMLESELEQLCGEPINLSSNS